jgi:hypothetical protein
MKTKFDVPKWKTKAEVFSTLADTKPMSEYSIGKLYCHKKEKVKDIIIYGNHIEIDVPAGKHIGKLLITRNVLTSCTYDSIMDTLVKNKTMLCRSKNQYFKRTDLPTEELTSIPKWTVLFSTSHGPKYYCPHRMSGKNPKPQLLYKVTENFTDLGDTRTPKNSLFGSILGRIEQVSGACFNNLQLILYLNGKEHISMHRDQYGICGYEDKREHLSTIHVGTARKLILQDNENTWKMEITLNHGDMYQMIGLQQDTQHGKLVQKESSSTYENLPSISLVARQLLNEDSNWSDEDVKGEWATAEDVQSYVYELSTLPKARILGKIRGEIPLLTEYPAGTDKLHELGYHLMIRRCVDYGNFTVKSNGSKCLLATSIVLGNTLYNKAEKGKYFISIPLSAMYNNTIIALSNSSKYKTSIRLYATSTSPCIPKTIRCGVLFLGSFIAYQLFEDESSANFMLDSAVSKE